MTSVGAASRSQLTLSDGSTFDLSRTPVLATWIGPHAIIWLPAAVVAWLTVGPFDCTGLCALYGAILTYLSLTLALFLSAIVLVGQLLILARHRIHQ